MKRNKRNTERILLTAGGIAIIGIVAGVIFMTVKYKPLSPVSYKGIDTVAETGSGTGNNVNLEKPREMTEQEAIREQFYKDAYETIHNTGKTYELSTDETSETTEDGIRLSKDGVYMADTIYDGKTSLPLTVFTTPFQKSVLYLSNKELLDKIGDENAEKIIKYATDSVNDIWGKDASYIRENKQAYVDTVSDYLINQTFQGQNGIDGDLYTNREVAESLADFFVNNNVEADVSFTTDKSLIYADSYIFIRGVLDITPRSCDTKEMPNFVPYGMDYKNGGKYVCEVAVGYYADIFEEFGVKEYQVVGYQIIDKIS